MYELLLLGHREDIES